jgi:hypothetical protein
MRIMAKAVVAVVSLALLVCSVLSGCGMVGAHPGAPNVVERALFDVVTNTEEVTVTKTNVHEVTVDVPVYKTNEVGVTVVSTNHVSYSVPEIVIGMQTNRDYSLTPKEATKGYVAGIGGIVNTFFPGAGSMVAAGLLAGLAAWGHLRSAKNKGSAISLAQEVESIREFIKTLPNGAKYDTAIKQWLQSHQVEEGVAKQVLDIVKNEISNPEAKAAIGEIQGTVDALKG